MKINVGNEKLKNLLKTIEVFIKIVSGILILIKKK